MGRAVRRLAAEEVSAIRRSLDQPIKSTGFPNWQHQSWRYIGDLYERDAQIVWQRFPETYWSSVGQNLARYFLPAGQTFPFDQGTHANGQALRTAVRVFDTVTAGQFARGQPAWFAVVGFPVAAAFGALMSARAAGTLLARQNAARQAAGPAGFTCAYMLFNIAYVSAVTILFSSGDHNRYRFPLTPLYGVLLAVFATHVWRRYARRNADASWRPTAKRAGRAHRRSSTGR